eukprot:5510840-Pleurochrysis_carterae.AAC.1
MESDKSLERSTANFLPLPLLFPQHSMRSICGAQILRLRTRSSMVFYRGCSTHRPLNPQSICCVCAERIRAPTAFSMIADSQSIIMQFNG